MGRHWIIGLAAIVYLGGVVRAAEPSLAEKYLYDGQLADGEKAMTAAIEKNPKDDQARFGLGVLQVVAAVEHLGQSLYHYGLDSDRGRRMQMPFLRLPVPTNPKPQPITYDDARKILENVVDDLAKAEATLAGVRDDNVKLPLSLGLVHLDLVGDGKSGDQLRTIMAAYMRGAPNAADDTKWEVMLDRGDVAWLQGYCHLLMTLAEVALAHDAHELFDCTAHIFFAKAQTPNAFLTDTNESMFNFSGVDVRDAIAFIHLLRFPVTEPERMKSALAHMQRMLALSKVSWAAILAETDDDHEWLPNPQQSGVLGVPVQQEMVDSWMVFIDEATELLDGKRLAPFWRGNEKRGVNLKRVFTEPRALDLVLWFQGSAATPYLEDGPLTRPEVWERMQRVFGGQFVGFAIWFN